MGNDDEPDSPEKPKRIEQDILAKYAIPETPKTNDPRYAVINVV